MKRRGHQLIEPSNRKKFFTSYQKDEELPFKLKLYKTWKLTPELSQYLSKSSKVEENSLKDQTSSNYSIVPYQPSIYEIIMNDLATTEEINQKNDYEMEIEFD